MTESSTSAPSYNERQVKFGNVVIKYMSKANTAIYKLTKGKIGAKFLHGAPVFLVTVTGRKTGQARTLPLLYLQDGEDYIIVASKGGMPHHPEWYLNLQADPRCSIQHGEKTADMVAHVVTGAEREELWTRLVEVYPDYDQYKERASNREIPVIRLSPATR